MPGMSNQPFLASSGNKYEAQKVKPGFVLAGMEGMTYNAGTFMMSPGDKFFQYTDGVPEAANNKNALYGMDRLEAVLNSNLDKKPNDLLPAVKGDLDALVGDAPQFDDITMLCLEFREYMVPGNPA
jgi:sigma-B regulation protein RsbU (phosphoserine phosphatase)